MEKAPRDGVASLLRLMLRSLRCETHLLNTFLMTGRSFFAAMAFVRSLGRVTFGQSLPWQLWLSGGGDAHPTALQRVCNVTVCKFKATTASESNSGGEAWWVSSALQSFCGDEGDVLAVVWR